MKRGRSVRIRNAGLTFSTYPVSGEFWALNVGITSQIQAFWNLQASQACFHYSMKVTYVGSAMSDGWMLNEFQKTFCLVNLQLAPDALQGPSSGASIQLPEKHWPQIEASGEQLSRLPQAWRGAGERAVEGKEKRSHHNSDSVPVFTRSTCSRAWGSRICMCSHSGLWNLKRVWPRVQLWDRLTRRKHDNQCKWLGTILFFIWDLKSVIFANGGKYLNGKCWATT